MGWGHEALLPAVIARDHSVAGKMLGSSLAWRAVLSVAVYLLLALGCYLANYPAEVQWALALTALLSTTNSMTAAYKDTIRGLERTDIPAYAHVAQQVIGTILVCLVLFAGGKLNAALLAQTIAAAIVLVATVRSLRSVGVERITADWAPVKTLTIGGVPFMALGFAMALQPSIDALFLSKMAPPEVMGWFGVTRRLVGALILPATALLSALYPTLCRLHGTDMNAFRRATSGALRSVSVVVGRWPGLRPLSRHRRCALQQDGVPARRRQPATDFRVPGAALLQHAAGHLHHGCGAAACLECGPMPLRGGGGRSGPLARADLPKPIRQRRPGCVRRRRSERGHHDRLWRRTRPARHLRSGVRADAARGERLRSGDGRCRAPRSPVVVIRGGPAFADRVRRGPVAEWRHRWQSAECRPFGAQSADCHAGRCAIQPQPQAGLRAPHGCLFAVGETAPMEANDPREVLSYADLGLARSDRHQCQIPTIWQEYVRVGSR